MLNPAGKAFVETACFGLAGADGGLHAGLAQRGQTLAGDGGVGIDGGGDDAGQTGFDERLRARAGAAGGATRLERNIGGTAAQAVGGVLPRFFEGGDLGVVLEGVLVPAFADKLASVVNQNATDGGVGRGDADAAARQIEGAGHPETVLVKGVCHVRILQEH